jgi:hypothetical protein
MYEIIAYYELIQILIRDLDPYSCNFGSNSKVWRKFTGKENFGPSYVLYKFSDVN